jgi:hypothetical protein
MMGVGMLRSRSGSRADENAPAPNGPRALRDLLKLSPAVEGPSDLLPPSPSALTAPKPFVALPSPLAFPPDGATQPGTGTQAQAQAAAHARALEQQQQNHHSSNNASTISLPAVLAPPTPGIPPPVPGVPIALRALDLTRVDDPAAALSELESTVDDLRRWLEVVERGLGDLLHGAVEDDFQPPAFAVSTSPAAARSASHLI